MTDAMGGLNALMLIGGELLRDARWPTSTSAGRTSPWWSTNGSPCRPATPSKARSAASLGLTAHPAFDPKNPNRLRALVSTFASGNPARFHDPSGAGYRFLADQILATDALQPDDRRAAGRAAGRLAALRPGLGALMKAELSRIAEHPGVSTNVLELASKALA